jgi:hypothetical protein
MDPDSLWFPAWAYLEYAIYIVAIILSIVSLAINCFRIKKEKKEVRPMFESMENLTKSHTMDTHTYDDPKGDENEHEKAADSLKVAEHDVEINRSNLTFSSEDHIFDARADA